MSLDGKQPTDLVVNALTFAYLRRAFSAANHAYFDPATTREELRTGLMGVFYPHGPLYPGKSVKLYLSRFVPEDQILPSYKTSGVGVDTNKKKIGLSPSGI